MGKISYGVYVYHPFMPLFLKFIFGKLGVAYDHESGWLNFALSSTATFAVASLSWYLMEKPINDLKRYFSYTGNRRATDLRLHDRAAAALRRLRWT